jgi:hypothetical protein
VSFSLLGHVALANAASSSTADRDTTGADLVVITVTDYSGQSPAVIGDNKGNGSPTALTSRVQGTVRQTLYYYTAPTVGAGHHWTVDGTNSFVAIAVAYFSGAATSLPKDQDSGAVTTSSTAQPGSIAPSEDDELIVCGVGSDGGSTTPDGAFTETDDVFYSPFFNAELSYQIQTTATAVNPSNGVVGTSNTVCSQASFKAAAGGGGGGTPLRRNALLNGLGGSGPFFTNPIGAPAFAPIARRAHAEAA